MKVLVTGTRLSFPIGKIVEELEKLPSDSVIIHGAATGVDTYANIVAEELNLTVRDYPANWHLHGKAAGPIRNREMFDSESPDLVLAFHQDLENSKGTKDMVNYARSKNCPVKIIS